MRFPAGAGSVKGDFAGNVKSHALLTPLVWQDCRHGLLEGRLATFSDQNPVYIHPVYIPRVTMVSGKGRASQASSRSRGKHG